MERCSKICAIYVTLVFTTWKVNILNSFLVLGQVEMEYIPDILDRIFFTAPVRKISEVPVGRHC